MSLAADFRPEAVADVVDTRRWYEEQEPGLGDTFADSIEEIVDRIKSMPRMYQEVLPAARQAAKVSVLRLLPSISRSV